MNFARNKTSYESWVYELALKISANFGHNFLPIKVCNFFAIKKPFQSMDRVCYRVFVTAV